MAKELNVTLVRSLIGTKPLQKKNVEALGLRKIRQTVKHSDTPQIRGAIEKVKHLVKVEEI